MISNIFLLSAALLSSTIYSAAGENANGLRGVGRADTDMNSSPVSRDLKMGMMSPTKRSHYYDDYYKADDYYYKGKGGKKGSKKGMSKGGKGSSKAKMGKGSSGKGKGTWNDESGSGKGSNLYPSVGDINFLDDNFFDDKFFADGNCQLVVLNETFTVPRASRFLAPDTTPENMGDPTLIGTVFIWEDQQIFEADGQVPLVGTRVSGTCTRTTVTQEGMGSCQLIFVDDNEFTINVDGLLEGPFGSSLAIVGGTGGMVGVIGEMDFFPIFNVGEFNGDVFINITRYEVDADLGLIICPTY